MNNENFEAELEIAAYCAAHNAIKDGTSTWPVGENINDTVTMTMGRETK